MTKTALRHRNGVRVREYPSAKIVVMDLAHVLKRADAANPRHTIDGKGRTDIDSTRKKQQIIELVGMFKYERAGLDAVMTVCEDIRNGNLTIVRIIFEEMRRAVDGLMDLEGSELEFSAMRLAYAYEGAVLAGRLTYEEDIFSMMNLGKMNFSDHCSQQIRACLEFIETTIWARPEGEIIREMRRDEIRGFVIELSDPDSAVVKDAGTKLLDSAKVERLKDFVFEELRNRLSTETKAMVVLEIIELYKKLLDHGIKDPDVLDVFEQVCRKIEDDDLTSMKEKLRTGYERSNRSGIVTEFD